MLHELRDLFNGGNNLCVIDNTFNLYKHHYISSASKDKADKIGLLSKTNEKEQEPSKANKQVLTGPVIRKYLHSYYEYTQDQRSTILEELRQMFRSTNNLMYWAVCRLLTAEMDSIVGECREESTFLPVCQLVDINAGTATEYQADVSNEREEEVDIGQNIDLMSIRAIDIFLSSLMVPVFNPYSQSQNYPGQQILGGYDTDYGYPLPNLQGSSNQQMQPSMTGLLASNTMYQPFGGPGTMSHNRYNPYFTDYRTQMPPGMFSERPGNGSLLQNNGLGLDLWQSTPFNESSKIQTEPVASPRGLASGKNKSTANQTYYKSDPLNKRVFDPTRAFSPDDRERNSPRARADMTGFPVRLKGNTARSDNIHNQGEDNSVLKLPGKKKGSKLPKAQIKPDK